MSADTRDDLRPGPSPRTVRGADGRVLDVPEGWALLDPGDANLTRTVKALGPSWTVAEKRGRKVFSRGVWAPAANIAAATAKVEAQRADPAHQRKLDAGRRRREAEQAEYVRGFEAEVLQFLAFHPRHAVMGQALAAAVTRHATPVGSGTVARTERIPVEDRAAAAVIAWMRHQTTGYDHMSIERVKGARREVRRELAQQSKALLRRYREDLAPAPDCPLARALAAVPGVAEGHEDSAAAARPSVAGPRPPIAPARAPIAAAKVATHPPSTPSATPTPAAGAPAPGAAPFAPRNEHEARQAALYEKVRARFKR